MNTDNLTEPLKATTQTSYFKTFLWCALVGPALVLSWLWLGRMVLQPADAETFKTVILGVWSLMTGGSGGASLIGGVARTFGKMAVQKAQVATIPLEAPLPDSNLGPQLPDDEDEPETFVLDDLEAPKP